MDTIKIPIPSDEIIHVAVYDKDGNFLDPSDNHYKIKIKVNKQELNFEYNKKDSKNCKIADVEGTKQLACFINSNTIKKPGLVYIAFCECYENEYFKDGIQDVWSPYELTNLEYIEL